jgi:hypothetical protein
MQYKACSFSRRPDRVRERGLGLRRDKWSHGLLRRGAALAPAARRVTFDCYGKLARLDVTFSRPQATTLPA